MSHQRLVATVVGASLALAGGFAASGCAGDANQPGRETISAPRKGGGVAGTAGEKVKPAAAAGSKADAK
jgi:hypothetical protein